MSFFSRLYDIMNDLFLCGVVDYIRFNFTSKAIHKISRSSRIRNYAKPSVEIARTAQIVLDGILNLNSAYIRGSGNKALLKVEGQGQLSVNGIFQSYYDTEIWIYPNGKLTLGHGYINAGTQIRCMESIAIGDGCAIGRNVMIMDFDAHEITYEDGSKNQITAPISIGKHVWIGAGATILKGVTIGDNAVIGAGSVVTKNVPANTIVAGNPSRVIKENIQWR